MAIHYCEETRQFYLHTHNTSYVMELYEGLLAHSYWGRSVDSIPVLDQMHPYRYGTDFSATDIPGRQFFSSDKLSQEELDVLTQEIAQYKTYQQPMHVRLQGLDPDTVYTDGKGNTFQGKTLMHLGIPVDTRADFKEALMVFEKQ